MSPIDLNKSATDIRESTSFVLTKQDKVVKLLLALSRDNEK
jgi:hypothetical protein